MGLAAFDQRRKVCPLSKGDESVRGMLARKYGKIQAASHLTDWRALVLRVPLATAMILVSMSLLARSQSTTSPAGIDGGSPSPNSSISVATGSICGTVLDKDGGAIPNVNIVFTEGSFSTQAQSGGDGTFTFKDVPAGSFDLSFSASGFATRHQPGTLQPGENETIAPVQLAVATSVEVNVTETRDEIAEDQVHVEEKQRLFGVVPNYYVSYVPDAAPLNTRQKAQLGWKFTVNPFAFGISGVIAGVQQANNSRSGCGQGTQGYAKRFGATYADFASGIFFGNVVFPILLKQDPRYFYKGTGSKKSRFFYAISQAVICKGNNGHWQPNYSSVLGSLAAGGLSNLYYPAANRNGVGLTFENTLIGIGGSAAGGVVEEFFSRRITAHARDRDTQ